MSEDFEERLKVLRSQLESERLKQVNTMKSVLERQQTSDIVVLEERHHEDLEDIRDGWLGTFIFRLY
jgi:hypothetical protein